MSETRKPGPPGGAEPAERFGRQPGVLGTICGGSREVEAVERGEGLHGRDVLDQRFAEGVGTLGAEVKETAAEEVVLRERRDGSSHRVPPERDARPRND